MHNNDVEVDLIFVPYGQYLWFLDQMGHWFECMDWGGAFRYAPHCHEITIEVIRTFDINKGRRDA